MGFVKSTYPVAPSWCAGAASTHRGSDLEHAALRIREILGGCRGSSTCLEPATALSGWVIEARTASRPASATPGDHAARVASRAMPAPRMTRADGSAMRTDGTERETGQHGPRGFGWRRLIQTQGLGPTGKRKTDATRRPRRARNARGTVSALEDCGADDSESRKAARADARRAYCNESSGPHVAAGQGGGRTARRDDGLLAWPADLPTTFAGDSTGASTTFTRRGRERFPVGQPDEHDLDDHREREHRRARRRARPGGGARRLAPDRETEKEKADERRGEDPRQLAEARRLDADRSVDDVQDRPSRARAACSARERGRDPPGDLSHLGEGHEDRHVEDDVHDRIEHLARCATPCRTTARGRRRGRRSTRRRRTPRRRSTTSRDGEEDDGGERHQPEHRDRDGDRQAAQDAPPDDRGIRDASTQKRR